MTDVAVATVDRGAEDAPAAQRSRVGAMGLTAILQGWLPFIAGFAATAACLHACRPGPQTCYVNIYTEKCVAASHCANSPTVLFVGTSRMFNGIDPRVVEDELQQLGRSESVWNLSLHNLSLAEQKQVILDIFNDLKLQPRIIVFEPSLRLGMTLENATTARSVYFSGWRGSRDSWDFIWFSQRDFARKCFNLGSCAVYFTVGLTNYGLFSDIFFPGRHDITAYSNAQTLYMLQSKGFWPAGMEADGIIKDQGPGNLRRVAALAESIERKERAGHDELPPVQATMIHHVDKLIKNHGVASLAVLMPQFWTTDPYYRRANCELARTLSAAENIDSLDYQSRATRPEFYDPDLWHDYNHFSETGANMFSREIAREVFQRLEGSK